MGVCCSVCSPAPSLAADMLLTQLESDSISEEQLAFRASKIYPELTVIEKRCEEGYDEHPESKTDSSKD
jgi:hypothetical protein